MPDRSRPWELVQQRVDVVQVIDLVEDDQMSAADPVELRVQFLERVGRSKSSLREFARVLGEKSIDQCANDGVEGVSVTVQFVDVQLIGVGPLRDLVLECFHHVRRDGGLPESGLPVQHNVLWSATEENVLERVAILIDLLVAFEDLIRLVVLGEDFLRDEDRTLDITEWPGHACSWRIIVNI